MPLYPLKFKPILKPRIWGGSKLQTQFGKSVPAGETIGESWELSAVEGDESEVKNGELAGNTITELVEIYMDELLGEKVFAEYGFNFPLLFKFLDAGEKLSIQLHPNDETAQEKHGCPGKTEMWYIVDAEPDAEIILGFNRATDRETYLQHLAAGTLETILQKIKVRAGDVYFIPAGLIHAIGKGIVIAEIQQSSDITYRLYDYNRPDKDGKLRELHTEQALEAIDFESDFQQKISPKGEALLRCDYFNVNKLSLSGCLQRDYGELDSFVVLMCISGNAKINDWDIAKGETVLIPAAIPQVNLQGDAELLEIFI